MSGGPAAGGIRAARPVRTLDISRREGFSYFPIFTGNGFRSAKPSWCQYG